MSFTSILKSELMKYKRSVLWKGVFLIPILSFAMLFADLHIRVSFLMSNDHIKHLAEIGIYSKLQALLYENHLATLWFILLNLSIVVVAVIVNYTEYSENTWKQIIARPVERRRIYISKWIIVLMAAIILVVLNGVSIMVVKNFFGINGDSTLIFKYKILEMCTVLGVVSFQQFISCYMKNSLVSAAVGFAGSIGAYMFAQSKLLSYIIPYANVILALPSEGNKDAQAAAFFGIASGVLWLVIGIIEFNKRDIK
ncbi:transporter [Clostridium carboxidivorans P7]|uniref:Transporter n=1 Tax=Clostridium carboxidivorans P7 TaxID=536227 RepID=C6PMW2_9CLOT|nr:ABC transporter permease [Clostridium carboxidivorans]AKN29808.1 transporter [Clostridium carboxidivorans P7]EET89540.1 transporter [Clostridium carboxidivorans P7]